jgi:paraquat-inducible protein B
MSPAKPAIVGAFVLSGAALAVGAVLLFAGSQLFTRHVHSVTYFQGSVAGLDVGAPVTFRGVKVGSVTRIGLRIDLKDGSAKIPVDVEIDPSLVSIEGRTEGNGARGDDKSVFRRLRAAGLQAQLSMVSFVTGQLAVELDLLPKVHATSLGGDVSGDEIPSSPSKLQTLEAEIAELPLKKIADDADRTLNAIQDVADQLRPRVGPMVDSLKRTSEAAHDTMDAAKVAVNHVDGLAVEGRRQVTANGDELQKVLASSDKTVRDADALVVSLHGLTGPDSRIREDLESATRDLAASASALRGFSHEIERDPSDLLRRGKPQ